MKIKKGYYAPTPKKMRKIGDTILLFGITTSAGVSSIGIDINSKWMIIAGISLSIISAIGKCITNFYTEYK